MKILQINTVYGEKSTGRTCLEVEKALIKKGYECCTAYGYGKSKNEFVNTYKIDTKLEYYIHNILSRVTGLEGYYSKGATKRLINFIKEYKPDVIHLRNLHGHYLCLPLLFEFLSENNIPIIQNLHDCWIYTGKCVYYSEINCYKWTNSCEKCKKKKEYPKSWFFDRSKRMRRDKEEWFKGIKNLTVVGVSNWVTNEAKKSFFNKITNNFMTIYNWINQDVFKPYPETNNEIRQKYGIPLNKFMIIGVSASWVENTPRYEDFLKLSKMLNEDEILVMIGHSDKSLGKNIKHIKYVENTVELAKLYSCADVYVHCSIEDTFGKVIAEAVACGTPAIVYDTTGCAEIVGDNSGYKVSPRNVEEIVEKIKIIKKKTKKQYENFCIERVKNNFNYETNANILINLYKKVCKVND